MNERRATRLARLSSYTSGADQKSAGLIGFVVGKVASIVGTTRFNEGTVDWRQERYRPTIVPDSGLLAVA
jgi:hypothetical protein